MGANAEFGRKDSDFQMAKIAFVWSLLPPVAIYKAIKFRLDEEEKEG